MFLKDAGIWDDDFVTLYTVETVLTQEILHAHSTVHMLTAYLLY